MSRVFLLLCCLVAMMALALGLDDLPSFPAAPASLQHLEHDDHAYAAIAEPQAARFDDEEHMGLSLLEVGEADPSLSAELAVAAVLPHESDEITAALALEVPDPATFLKDDPFLQMLEKSAQEKAKRDRQEALGVDAPPTPAAAPAAAAAPKANEPVLKANAPSDLEQFARQRLQAEAPGVKLPPSGRDVVPPPPKRAAEKQYAPRDRRFAGENLRKEGRLFPSHNRGHIAKRFPLHDQAPHQEDISRRFRDSKAQPNFSKGEFKYVNRPAVNSFPHHGGHLPEEHNKGRPLAKATIMKRKAKEARREPSRLSQAAKQRQFEPRQGPSKKERLERAAKARADAQAAARAQRNADAKAAGGKVSFAEMSSTATATRSKRSRAADVASAGIEGNMWSGNARLQGASAPNSVQPTNFPQSFEHVRETRRELRAQSRRFKEEERAALALQGDAERLSSLQKERQAILDAHKDAAIKARANLHTMVGASNGVFDRLPSHDYTGRGSAARRSWTPARRIVPQRLARLEEQRMQARRRSFSRGNMAEKYHSQLHGALLGVAAPTQQPQSQAPVDGHTVLLETQSDALQPPPMRDLPPEF